MVVDVKWVSLQEAHHCAFLSHLPRLQRVEPDHDATQTQETKTKLNTEKDVNTHFHHNTFNTIPHAACIHTLLMVKELRTV